ncbi:hypothetical protein BLNAU_7778 [Blattamonas nauphoetae]|uniref:Uncharacterized protein n=1 Tax=Blattamonas nauphoetae TaxID=2049346 RepID=A0ABQ9Y0F8_9EUKA|nr:hypothetical protein BLNAU_7778 [Blattamonas nauphoetae]
MSEPILILSTAQPPKPKPQIVIKRTSRPMSPSATQSDHTVLAQSPLHSSLSPVPKQIPAKVPAIRRSQSSQSPPTSLGPPDLTGPHPPQPQPKAEAQEEIREKQLEYLKKRAEILGTDEQVATDNDELARAKHFGPIQVQPDLPPDPSDEIVYNTPPGFTPQQLYQYQMMQMNFQGVPAFPTQHYHLPATPVDVLPNQYVVTDGTRSPFYVFNHPPVPKANFNPHADPFVPRGKK